MSPRAVLSGLSILLVALSVVACDRSESTRGMPLEAAGRRTVQLRTLTQLLPNRPTHLAADRLAQVFWVQQTEDGQDVLFHMAEGGIPRATRLTSTNIVSALAEEGDDGGEGKATGNIRALSPAERGVYFYFYGFKGNTPKACLGQYLPQSGRIRILADTAALEGVSGMGRSLQLARATLVTSGPTVWLWVRHTDGSKFITFETRMLGPFGPAELKVPFEKVASDDLAVQLTRSEGDISPGPGGSLLLVDFDAGILWRIEPDGSAAALFSLIGLPRQLAPPTVAPDGRLLMFAAESQRIGSELAILTRQDLPKIDYPALLELAKGELQFIARDNIRAHTGFPVYATRLGRLVPESLGHYVSYDSASGALMRVKIVED